MKATPGQRTFGLVVGVGAFSHGLRVLSSSPSVDPAKSTPVLVAWLAAAVGLICIFVCCFTRPFTDTDSGGE